VAFLFTTISGVFLSSVSQVQGANRQVTLTSLEQLGKALFFDKNLSKNGNQSCASCHDPAVGYTGPSSPVNAGGAVYSGSDATLFGNRKPPSAAYAGDSGLLQFDSNLKSWSGGMFWDGRADGKTMSDPLAEQAKGPFLNPLEMALTSPEELYSKIVTASYAGLFKQVWGMESLDSSKASTVYDQVGIAIAAYERSAEINPYNSKFDLFWDKAKTKRLDVNAISISNWTKYRNLGLNDTELYGLAAFNDPAQANCAACHSLKAGSKGYPLFTDYSYDNLGVPRNPANPFYSNTAYNPEGASWVDTGLGGYLGTAPEKGKMKVPTLRNVDKRPSANFVKAYGHNGYFKTLSDIIRFYHWRGMGMGSGGGMGGGGMMFPPPEVNENLATLGMFPGRDQSYILAFLKTLSDGYFQR
jgi:cytochrome c peroxidase